VDSVRFSTIDVGSAASKSIWYVARSARMVVM